MNQRELYHLLRGLGVILFVVCGGWLLNDTALASQLKRFLIDNDLLADHAVSNVRLRGQTGGMTNAVFVKENKAFIGEGPRLTIWEVSNPAQPVLLGKTLPFPDLVYGLFVEGSLAYVADGFGGLRVVNIANPASPVEVGFYDTPGNAVGVYVVGATAYVADSQNGLRVVNVATPASPAEVGFYDTPGNAVGVYVAGTTAYVADSFSGLRLVNVTNPASPVEAGFYDTPGVVYGVQVVGTLAYVADGYNGLRVVNVANPASPVELGSYPLIAEARGVYIAGATAYVANGFNGLRVINVTNPASPVELGFYASPDYALGVYAVENTAYLADRNGGWRVVNVSNPASPTEVAAYDPTQEATNVYVAGNLAYLTDGYGGFRVVNISNAANPVQVGAYDTPDYANSVVVVNNIAYLADGTTGLRVLNVSNPATPSELGFYNTPGYANSVFVVGTRAYVADGFSGLRVLSVGNPAIPVEIGFYDTPGFAVDVQVVGNTAYIADTGSGLRVVNVANPSSPVEIGFYDTPDAAQSVQVVGALAYIADGTSGLQIVNVANAASPTAVGFYDTPGYALSVQIVGNTAYVADGYSGLRVVNVAAPASPAEVGFYDTIGYAYGLHMVGSTAYLADFFGGLWVLQSPPCYRLNLQHTGSGSNPTATPPNSTNCPAGEYLFGELISLSAQPDPDWRITSWQGSNNDNTTSKNNTLTMPAAEHEVMVTYAPCHQLKLNHSGAGGVPVATPANSNGCSTGRYVFGELISFSAAPATEWRVGSWIGTNNDPTTAANNVLTMPAAPHEVIVNYITPCYPLSLQHSGSGSDPVSTPPNSPTCPLGQFAAGEPVNLHASPASGWRISRWTGAAENSTSTDNRLVMPASSQAISVTYTAIPITNAGDAYEEDNTCAQAHALNSDGVDQTHTFHRGGDEDWLSFAALAQTRYRIEVNIPSGSPADVELEVYRECTGALVSKFEQSFSPGVRLDITPTTTAPIYLRLRNVDAAVGSANVTYQVAVRPFNLVRAANNENRAVIVVGGSFNNPDRLQKNINHVTEAVYNYFRTAGYGAADITYLSSDATLANRTGPTTLTALQTAITVWAKQRLTVGGQLTLYLMDHGDPDKFYLDNVQGQVLTPQQLDSWLDQLEASLPELKVTVIIEACHSGSFINGEQSISKDEPGRLVLTSTNEQLLAYASTNGAYFSDFMLATLQQGYNLHGGFKASYAAVREMSNLLQEPWLDGNGNGIPNEPADITLASQRSADAEQQGWAPYIVSARGPTAIVNQRGVLQAVVRDDKQVRRVWAVIKPPSYRPPEQSSELVAETLPTMVLTAQGNETFAAEYPGFDQLGVYRIALYAEDNENLVALPTVIEVVTGSRLFLPVIGR